MFYLGCVLSGAFCLERLLSRGVLSRIHDIFLCLKYFNFSCTCVLKFYCVKFTNITKKNKTKYPASKVTVQKRTEL